MAMTMFGYNCFNLTLYEYALSDLRLRCVRFKTTTSRYSMPYSLIFEIFILP